MASQHPPYPPSAAELASLLVRSISYEIPSLRKQISRCQQAQQDFARREEECQLGAAELRERFFASCKQYGITVSPCSQPLLRRGPCCATSLPKAAPKCLCLASAGLRLGPRVPCDVPTVPPYL